MASIRLMPERTGGSSGLIGPTYHTAIKGNLYHAANNGKLLLHVKNSGAKSAAVTVVTHNTARGIRLARQRVVIPPRGGEAFVGPLDPQVFNTAVEEITFRVSGRLKVAVLQAAR